MKKVSEYDQKIPQSDTVDQLTAPRRRATGHQEDKQSKATNSLFPIKMIAKLERTHSNVKQNMEQTQNPTMGATINNESTTTEPPPKNDQYLPFICTEKQYSMHLTTIHG